MPPTATSSAAPRSTGWSRSPASVLPVTIVGAILVFIIPVPPAVLDLLLSANITLAVLVLADHAGDPQPARVHAPFPRSS